MPSRSSIKNKLIQESREAKGFVREFQEFITRGNVIDLAVGIIIGAAFTGVVDSLVKDVIMPPIGFIAGRVDFSELFVSLNGASYPTVAAALEAGAPVLRYGVFINTIINFLIVGLAVFLLVKQVNRLQRKQADAKQQELPAKRFCQYCMQEVHEQATKCPYCTSELGG